MGMRDDLDQLTPHNLEAEAAALAVCMVAPEAIPIVLAEVEPKEFFREHNGWILEAIQAVYERSGAEGVNRVTIAHELAQRDRLEDIGGRLYLSDLERQLPTTIHPEFYPRIVRSMALARKAISVGYSLEMAARSQPDAIREVIDEAVERLLSLGREEGARKDVVTIKDVFSEGLWTKVESFMDKPWDVPGAKTGWQDFDRAIGGFERGKVYLYGSETSMGKSLFAQDIIRRLASKGTRCLVFSTEMSRDDVGWRWTFQEAGLDPTEQTGGFTSGDKQAVRDAMQKVSDWPITTCDRGDLSGGYLRSVVRRVMAEHPDLHLICVDHVDMMRGAGKGRTADLEDLTRDLKTIARDLGVAVLEVSHVSRLNEYNSRTKSARFRNSESKAQDADVGWMLEPIKQSPTGEWVPMLPDEAREAMANGIWVNVALWKQRFGRTRQLRLWLSWRTGGRYSEEAA